MHPRHHIDCVQLGFHIPTLPPPFLPAGTPAPFNFVIWSIILCLVFCSRRFVFFLLSFHFPTEDVFPFLFEPSERAISFYWLPRLHTTQSLCVRIALSHSSRPPSSRLSHRKTVGPCSLPQNFVVPLPALGKKGGAVTADSPCSCTAESRDCRARSSLHVGDRYPIVSRRSCSSTSARMNVFSSLVLLSLPCRRCGCYCC